MKAGRWAALVLMLSSGCTAVLGIEDRTYAPADGEGGAAGQQGGAASGGKNDSGSGGAIAGGGAPPSGGFSGAPVAGSGGQSGGGFAGTAAGHVGVGGGAGTSSGTAGTSGAAGSTNDCLDVCVPAAPVEWTGPFWYSEGPYDSAPSCPGGTAQGASVFDGITFDPAACSACACQGTSPGCTTLVELNCSGAVSEITVSAETPACLSLSVPNATSIEFLQPAVAAVTCASEGGSLLAKPAAPTWKVAGIGCTPPTTTNDCPAKSICTTAPPAPFTNWCIARAGSNSCPSGPYSKAHVHFTQEADTRGCAACSCVPPPPDSLCILGSAPVVFGAQDAACTSSVTPYATAPGTCVDGAPSSFSFARVDLGAKPDPNAPGCTPGGGGPAGSVVGTSPVTVCCSE